MADLTWSINTSCQVGKIQQCLYFLRKLEHAHLPLHLLVNFYRAAIESILTYYCTVWFTSCTAEGRTDLQQVVKVLEKATRTTLPSL